MDSQSEQRSNEWAEQLDNLAKTPLGRRWLLKMGGAGAGALALQRALPAFAAGKVPPAPPWGSTAPAGSTS